MTATQAIVWQALAAALTAPLPADRPWRDLTAPACRCEASRLWCAWLAGLAQLEQAGVAPVGLPRSADLMATLLPTPTAEPAHDPAIAATPSIGPHAPRSVAALFAAMVDALAVLDPTTAAALLDQRLRQDWALLPAPVKARLRTACVQAGERVLAALVAALATAADADAVLAITTRYAQRPALVVAALAALARAAPNPDPCPDPKPDPKPDLNRVPDHRRCPGDQCVGPAAGRALRRDIAPAAHRGAQR